MAWSSMIQSRKSRERQRSNSASIIPRTTTQLDQLDKEHGANVVEDSKRATSERTRYAMSDGADTIAAIEKVAGTLSSAQSRVEDLF